MIELIRTHLLYAAQHLDELLLGLAVILFGNAILVFAWGAMLDGRSKPPSFREVRGFWIGTIAILLLDLYYATLIIFAVALRNYK